MALLSGFDLREYNRNVLLFFLFAIPLFAGMGLFSLLYNLYLTRLSYQEDFIGQMAGLFPLASGLCAIPTGLLSDRIGRKPFLVAAALVLGSTQLGLCLIDHPTVLLIFSFVGGSAGAFVFVNFTPFLAENAASEHRGQAISIWMSIQLLTRMVISLAGGALPGLMGYLTGVSTDLPEPFRYALLLGAACSFLALVPLLGLRLSPPKPATTGLASAPGAESPVPWKYLVILGSITGFRGLSMGLSFPFFNVFFQEELHVSVATIGLIFFLSQGVGLFSTVSAPALDRRLGSTLAIVPVRLLGALCLGGMGWMIDFHLAVLLFLGMAATETVTTPIEITFATRIVSRAHWGRMQSFRVTGFQILSGLGSFAAGWLILEYGYGVSFALAGFFALASAVVFLVAFGYRRPGEGGGG